jgi:hypothetical protein
MIKDLSQMMTNLKRCQFKLENVNNFQLAGISLSKFSKLSDVSLFDAAKLVKAFSDKKFPANFTLNVAASNPNDGTGGTKQTTTTLTSLAWTLILDNVTTITGNIDKPIEIPGTGQKTMIPLTMGLDLYQFFAAKGYESIVDLAMALGGVKGSAARITLKAKPTVSTPLGPIAYPGEINIIDKEFRGE